MTITDSFRDYRTDLDGAAAKLELARATPVSGGTFARTYITVHCPSADAVDAAAVKWSEAAGSTVLAGWHQGQYEAELDDGWACLRAVFMPVLPPRGLEAGAEAVNGAAA